VETMNIFDELTNFFPGLVTVRLCIAILQAYCMKLTQCYAIDDTNLKRSYVTAIY